ncbi:MAG: fabF [Verrucomicrobiaceae bacterium]|nr:fabF [Verrucomicrobiaceae bacterium]
MGVVSPLGVGKEAFWRGLQAQRSPVRELTLFDTQEFKAKHASWIEDWQPRQWIAPHRLKRMDRFAQFSCVAGHLAVQDAGLDLSPTRPNLRAGISLGSALGGYAYAETQHSAYLAKGIKGLSPSLGVQGFGGSAQGNLAIEFGLQGPGTTNANTCAAGNAALGDALRLIQYGSADVVLAGAAETPLSPVVFAAFDNLHTMSRCGAYRPYHRARDGFIMGEGAALFVVESLAHARQRGARIYAEIAGYGLTNDAHHMSSPEPSGRALQAAMRLALEDAGTNADAIDYISAHASGTPANDPNELAHIAAVFGGHAKRIPISGVKPFVGHTLGAAGALEIAMCLLAMKHSWVPPTLGLDEVDASCAGFNLVPQQAQESPVRQVLSNSLGFSGINTSLVLRAV